MPGTFVRDATGPDLLSGATLNAAGTTNGTGVDLQYPGFFQVELVTGTVTGTSPTLNVTIEAADDSAFSGSDLVTLGRFDALGDNDNATRKMVFYTNKRWVRSEVVVGGTSPVYTGSTAKVVPLRDRWTTTVTA